MTTRVAVDAWLGWIRRNEGETGLPNAALGPLHESIATFTRDLDASDQTMSTLVRLWTQVTDSGVAEHDVPGLLEALATLEIHSAQLVRSSGQVSIEAVGVGSEVESLLADTQRRLDRVKREQAAELAQRRSPQSQFHLMQLSFDLQLHGGRLRALSDLVADVAKIEVDAVEFRNDVSIANRAISEANDKFDRAHDSLRRSELFHEYAGQAMETLLRREARR